MRCGIYTRFFSKDYYSVLGDDTHTQVLKELKDTGLADTMEETKACFVWYKNNNDVCLIRITGIPSKRGDRLRRPIRYTLSFIGSGTELNDCRDLLAENFLQKPTILISIGKYLDSFVKNNEEFCLPNGGETEIRQGLKKTIQSVSPKVESKLPEKVVYVLYSPLFNTAEEAITKNTDANKKELLQPMNPETIQDFLPDSFPSGIVIADGKYKEIPEKKNQKSSIQASGISCRTKTPVIIRMVLLLIAIGMLTTLVYHQISRKKPFPLPLFVKEQTQSSQAGLIPTVQPTTPGHVMSGSLPPAAKGSRSTESEEAQKPLAQEGKPPSEPGQQKLRNPDTSLDRK